MPIRAVFRHAGKPGRRSTGLRERRTSHVRHARNRSDHRPHPRALASRRASPISAGSTTRPASSANRADAVLRQPRARLCRLLARPTRRRSPATRCPTSASSPPTTTCCRRISPSRPIPALIKQAAREAGGIGAGGRRRAGDVRRRHAGPAGHGAVAVFARRDRHGGGDRPVAQHVRCRGLSSASATRSCRAW